MPVFVFGFPFGEAAGVRAEEPVGGSRRPRRRLEHPPRCGRPRPARSSRHHRRCPESRQQRRPGRRHPGRSASPSRRSGAPTSASRSPRPNSRRPRRADGVSPQGPRRSGGNAQLGLEVAFVDPLDRMKSVTLLYPGRRQGPRDEVGRCDYLRPTRRGRQVAQPGGEQARGVGTMTVPLPPGKDVVLTYQARTSTGRGRRSTPSRAASSAPPPGRWPGRISPRGATRSTPTATARSASTPPWSSTSLGRPRPQRRDRQDQRPAAPPRGRRRFHRQGPRRRPARARPGGDEGPEHPLLRRRPGPLARRRRLHPLRSAPATASTRSPPSPRPGTPRGGRLQEHEDQRQARHSPARRLAPARAATAGRSTCPDKLDGKTWTKLSASRSRSTGRASSRSRVAVVNSRSPTLGHRPLRGFLPCRSAASVISRAPDAQAESATRLA